MTLRLDGSLLCNLLEVYHARTVRMCHRLDSTSLGLAKPRAEPQEEDGSLSVRALATSELPTNVPGCTAWSTRLCMRVDELPANIVRLPRPHSARGGFETHPVCRRTELSIIVSHSAATCYRRRRRQPLKEQSMHWPGGIVDVDLEGVPCIPTDRGRADCAIESAI